MAKSKPIGVRFDLDKLDMIQKEQNLTSVQQVVNYLMANYGSKDYKEPNTVLLTPWGDRISKEGIKRGAPFKNMPPYGTGTSNLADMPANDTVTAEVNKEVKNEPKEGSLAWFMKNS